MMLGESMYGKELISNFRMFRPITLLSSSGTSLGSGESSLPTLRGVTGPGVETMEPLPALAAPRRAEVALRFEGILNAAGRLQE